MHDRTTAPDGIRHHNAGGAMGKLLTIRLTERERDTLALLTRDAGHEARQDGDGDTAERLTLLAMRLELAEYGEGN